MRDFQSVDRGRLEDAFACKGGASRKSVVFRETNLKL